MANLVQDRMWALPGDVAWQDDADTTDANQPQTTDFMGASSPTGLASELRAMKSVLKGTYKDPIWVNFTGDLQAPDPNPAVNNGNSTTSFFLLGNWETNAIAPHYRASAGRAVRLSDTSSPPIQTVGVIVSANFNGAHTQVNLNTAAVPAALAYVEFSAVNALDQNPLWLNFDTVGSDFVVPVTQGGTGQNNATASGDLSGDYPGPTVAKVGNSPVKVPLTAPSTSNVLAWSGTLWDSASLTTLLNLAQISTANGRFVVPTIGAGLIQVQWGTVTVVAADFNPGKATVDVTFPVPYDSICFLAHPAINQVNGDGSARFTLETFGLFTNGARFYVFLVAGTVPTDLTLTYVAIGL